MNGQQHEASDFIGAYVLDALGPEEVEWFEAHLAGCPECCAEVDDLTQVVDVLPLAVDPVEPPAGLRDRIVTRAAADLGEPAPFTILPGGRAEADRPDKQSRFSRLDPRVLLPALAVAAAVILALGAWNITLQTQSKSTNANPSFSAVVTALAQGATVSPVASTTGSLQAHAALVQPPHGRPAYFVVAGLPAPPSNKVYQLWLIRGASAPKAAPVSAGVFSSSASSTQVVKVPMSSQGYGLTAVTVEHGPHGSKAPTTKPILLGKLTA